MKRRKSDRQAIAERLEYLCEYFKNKPNDRWNYPVVAELFEAFLVRRGWSRPTVAPGPVPASHEAGEGERLTDDDVEWIVNDIAELGVKIGGQFFFLYKGRSYKGGAMWRPVFKREFGECCHPWQAIERKIGEALLPDSYIGFLGEDREGWKPIPHEHDDDCPPECKPAAASGEAGEANNG